LTRLALENRQAGVIVFSGHHRVKKASEVTFGLPFGPKLETNAVNLWLLATADQLKGGHNCICLVTECKIAALAGSFAL